MKMFLSTRTKRRTSNRRRLTFERRWARHALHDSLLDVPRGVPEVSTDDYEDAITAADREWLNNILDDAAGITERDVKDTQSRLRATAKVTTHEFRRGDRRVRTHPLILQWLDANLPDSVPGNHARREILLLVESAQRKGTFKFSTKRVRAVMGKKTDSFLRVFVGKCPFVRKVLNYCPGVRSNRYGLVMPDMVHNDTDDDVEIDNDDLPTVNGYGVPTKRWSWQPAYPTYVDIPREWLIERSIRWHHVAIHEEWFNSNDYHGSNFSGAIQTTLQSVTVDRHFDDSCPDYCDAGDWEGGKREHHVAFHRKLIHRSQLRCVRYVRGRLYHALTSCPKTVRRHLRIAGERIGEVDVSGSYLCALASQLWEDTEFRRQQKLKLINWLTSGEIYERVAKKAGFDWTDRNELKQQFQKQCLFWKDGTPAYARPLWNGLQRLFPDLARLIEGVRRDAGGASGLSDYLMWRESQTMFAIFKRLGEEGIPFLPNHDGILVPKSYVNQVSEITKTIATRVLGFEPAVKTK